MPRTTVAPVATFVRDTTNALGAGQTPQLGAFNEGTQRVAMVRERLWQLIVQLNEHADAVFGATPTGGETGKTEPQPSGALGRMFVEIDHLEAALPSLERVIERFTCLA